MDKQKLVAHYTKEEVKKNYLEYTAAHDQLESDFDGFIAQFVPNETPEGQIVGFCTWTNFISTIMPLVDYVTLVTIDGDSTSVYYLEQPKLLEILPGYFECKESPVKHFVLKDLELDEEMRRKVLEASTLLKKME